MKVLKWLNQRVYFIGGTYDVNGEIRNSHSIWSEEYYFEYTCVYNIKMEFGELGCRDVNRIE